MIGLDRGINGDLSDGIGDIELNTLKLIKLDKYITV